MIKPFSEIESRAIERKGGQEALNKLVNEIEILTSDALSNVPDDRFLSSMTQAVFQAGFNWQVIRNKWDGFEGAFWGFDVERCAFMAPDDYEALLRDTRIVRNGQKIMTVPQNAQMILNAQKDHGSFAKMVAEWPSTDFIGLLDFLKKHGSRLGGASSQYFLRYIGRDGFILGKDGVSALIGAGVIDKKPTSKSDMRAVQQAYNMWMEETGYNLAEISKILAFSIDS